MKNGDENTVIVCKKELKKLIAKGYKPLIRQLETFYAAFKAQWYRENKPFGFEVQDVRIGGLIHRVRHCASDLGDLIKGKISSIPELEEYLLPADVTKYYPDRHCYGMSVTANKLS